MSNHHIRRLANVMIIPLGFLILFLTLFRPRFSP
jgi:hypothetical protein